MGAYDNPTIIKDMYGAEAWAAAANQVSNASVGMVKSFADTAVKRAEKAEKEEEDRSALEASVIRRQSEAANQNFNSEAWANAPKSLIEQAKEYNNFSMLGGVHMYNGSEVDFGIGSVKADMLVSDSNTSPEDKIKYMAVVNDLNNSLKTFSTEAALVLADEEDFNNSLTSKGSFYSGNNASERFDSQLVANALYNKNGIMPDGFKVDKRYSKVFKDKSSKLSQTLLSFDFTTNINNPLLPEDVREQYKNKQDKDGNIVIKKEYNLSNGSFNGNLINPAELENADYISASKGLTNEAGVFSDKMEVPLASSSNIQKGKDINVQTVSKWMDVGAYESAVGETVKKQAGEAFSLMNQTQQGFEAYLRNVQPRSAMPEYNKLLENKKLTPDEIVNLLEETEMKSAKYKVGLLEGVSDPDGFQMVKRAITQSEIDDLKAAGIPAAENMNAGDMQYFKTKSTEKQKTKPGGSGDGSSSGGSKEEREKLAFAKDVANNPDTFKVMRTIPGSGGRKIKLNEDGTYKIFKSDDSPVIGRTKVTKEELMKIYPIK
tara:strand:+ start:255 stop:1892 length:1638 start_codon:yes stop_codon:yes gene_type:complete